MSDEDLMAPVELPIDGELDLHTFHPKDIKELLADYILACREENILQIRIVHGKGKGVLREAVHSILEKHPQVECYWQEGSAGSWGATLARLRPLAGGGK